MKYKGFVPSSPILINLMTEALSSSETPVHTRDTRRNILEDGILQRFGKYINCVIVVVQEQSLSVRAMKHF
jgi:hypothetical protein